MTFSECYDALASLIEEGSHLNPAGRAILIDLIRKVDVDISFFCSSAGIEAPGDYDPAYRVIAGDLMGHGVAIDDNYAVLDTIAETVSSHARATYSGLLDDTGGGALYSFVAPF